MKVHDWKSVGKCEAIVGWPQQNGDVKTIPVVVDILLCSELPESANVKISVGYPNTINLNVFIDQDGNAWNTPKPAKITKGKR